MVITTGLLPQAVVGSRWMNTCKGFGAFICFFIIVVLLRCVQRLALCFATISLCDTPIVSRLTLQMRKLKYRNVKWLTQSPAAEATLSVRSTFGWLQKPSSKSPCYSVPLPSVFCLLGSLLQKGTEASKVKSLATWLVKETGLECRDPFTTSHFPFRCRDRGSSGSQCRLCFSCPVKQFFLVSDQNLSCFYWCPTSFAESPTRPFSSLFESVACESMSPSTCHLALPCLSPPVHCSISPWGCGWDLPVPPSGSRVP